MSIEAVNPGSTPIPYRFEAAPGDHRPTADVINSLQALLQADPKALERDPALNKLYKQAMGLAEQVNFLSKEKFKGTGFEKLGKKMLQKLHRVLAEMQARLPKLLKPKTPTVTEAATSRYGRDFAAQVDKIMNSNASLEDKLAMLGGLMADKLDGEIEKLMKEYSKELKKPQDGGAQGTASGVGNALLAAIPYVGPIMAAVNSGIDAATKGSSDGKRDKQKIDQIQTQIQLLMDKKKNFLQMVSNLMAAESRTQNAIISNIRG